MDIDNVIFYLLSDVKMHHAVYFHNKNKLLSQNI